MKLTPHSTRPLSDRHERLDRALQCANIGTWEYDVASSTTYFDAVSASLVGREPAPFVADLDWFRQITYGGDLERARTAVLAHIKGEVPWFECEYRMQTASGQLRWIFGRGRASERASDGKVTWLSGVMMDIDARKRAELAMTGAESRLDTAMSGANVALYTVDLQNNQAFHSSSWSQMSGFDRTYWRVSTDPWKSHLHPDDAQRVLARVRDYLDGRSSSYEVEYRFVTKSGRTIWLFDRASIVERDASGRPLTLAGTLVDISARKLAEEAQRQSDFRYRSVANMTLGYVHESRFDETAKSGYRVIWASNGFTDVFGCSVEEYNRRGGVFGFYHPQDLAGAQVRLAALRRGERSEGEVRLTGADGKVRWLHSVNEPLRDADTGEVIGILGVGHDVTTRKLSDQALRQSEALLRSLTENAPDWLLLLDVDFRIQWINRALFDIDPQELIGQNACSYLGADDGSRARAELEHTMALGDGATYVWHRDHEDGVTRFYENHAAPVFDEGRIVGLSVRISDITARQRAQETLQTQALILETIREGVVLFDSSELIRFTNPAFARMFGYGAAELRRLKVGELGILPRSVAAMGPFGASALEFVGLRKDGTHFLAEAVFNVLVLRDRQMLIGVVQDITDRKSLEREIIEVANREQRRIGSDLHDGLGQELTGIALLLRSFSEQLARDYPQGCAAVDEVIGIVNQAINGARALARGLSPVTLEHGGLLTALRALAANAKERYGLSVRFRSRTATPPQVDGATANHLYRIAQEALTNAARHSGANSVWLQLRIETNQLQMTIADNGCGLQSPANTQPGMGLRIMDYRARMIGGTLSIGERRGGGLSIRLVCRQTVPSVLQTGVGPSASRVIQPAADERLG